MKARVCRHITERGRATGGRYPHVPHSVPATRHETQTQNSEVNPKQTSQFPFSLCGNYQHVELKRKLVTQREKWRQQQNHFMSAEERGSSSGGWARASLSTAVQPGTAMRQRTKADGEVVGRNQTSQLSNCVCPQASCYLYWPQFYSYIKWAK